MIQNYLQYRLDIVQYYSAPSRSSTGHSSTLALLAPLGLTPYLGSVRPYWGPSVRPSV